MFRDGRVTDMSVKEAMRRSLESAKNLERIALGKGVSIVEPFAGTSAFGNRVLVVGPRRRTMNRCCRISAARLCLQTLGPASLRHSCTPSKILQRRSTLGADAYVFGSTNGEHQPTIQTAWETLKLLAHGIEPKAGREGLVWNQEQLRRIDLRWHDLRHEGAGRLLADGVDIRMIQLMLGHASIQQTQRYLNVTDEELRRGLEVSWQNQGRPLRLAAGS